MLRGERGQRGPDSSAREKPGIIDFKARREAALASIATPQTETAERESRNQEDTYVSPNEEGQLWAAATMGTYESVGYPVPISIYEMVEAQSAQPITEKELLEDEKFWVSAKVAAAGVLAGAGIVEGTILLVTSDAKI